MRGASVALIALVVASCSGDELPGTREHFAKEGFSIHVPDHWSTEREPGGVVFVGDTDRALDRNTIAVRVVARTGDWVAERTPDLVLPATAKALGALPGAAVGSATPLTVDGLVGASFELTFSPVSAGGERFQRRHVVLVGKGHVFHITHTAPEGELAKSASEFDVAVKSLREEG